MFKKEETLAISIDELEELLKTLTGDATLVIDRSYPVLSAMSEAEKTEYDEDAILDLVGEHLGMILNGVHYACDCETVHFFLSEPTDECYAYAVLHWWDTPDVEGNEILDGVAFKDFEDARALMKSSAETLKKEFDETVWDSDLTWETDDQIHMGFDPCQAFAPATLYAWDIIRIRIS